MKKIKVIMLMLIAMFGFTSVVHAGIPSGSSDMSIGECLAFSDAFKTIARNEGQYYYKTCFRAACSSKGKYELVNNVMISGYRCANGNVDPYHKTVSNGCAKYTGTCDPKKNPYCTAVELVDCNKNSNGTAYIENTTKPITTTTTKRVTTTTNKVVKTTTKAVKTTKKASQIIITTTTTTTTTTTARKSNNTNIKKITINNETQNFNNKKNEYPLPIPAGIDDVLIEVELEDPKASVVIEGDTNIANDEPRDIKIIVTAEDGTTKVIVFHMTRAGYKKNDCTLAQIFIKDYPIEFASNNYAYNLKLPKEVKSLDIEVIPTTALGTKYSIENNENLKHKSIIDILVVSEDGTECNYKIHISKDNNLWKLIVLIVIIVAGLVVAAIFLFRYLKKSKGKYKYE